MLPWCWSPIYTSAPPPRPPPSQYRQRSRHGPLPPPVPASPAPMPFAGASRLPVAATSSKGGALQPQPHLVPVTSPEKVIGWGG